MSTYRNRMHEIVRIVARKAWEQPVLSSGLWFHGDIRDNFYYASYLFAASVDPAEDPTFDRQEGKKLAEQILFRVLRLQDTRIDSITYGHWPLSLETESAQPHVLPVELMGSLMVFFLQTYEQHMSKELAELFDGALENVYQGGFYKQPLRHYGHHEAKFTAAKLIFGQRFRDDELLAEGRSCLRQTLEHIRREGMAEYGSLPWFWHWIQAFTCAWTLLEEPAVKSELSEMLDHLWNVRALYYLKGAWIGAHSRGWSHDAPKDGNVLHDYVQFGDFGLPEDMPRIEYAGFLFYEAPKSARRLAMEHVHPAEISRAFMKEVDGVNRKLHSYVYVNNRFAAGGLWERVKEFDNEQLRWLFSLPVRLGGKGNQLYFFHPGEGYNATGSDPRHQSEWTAVLYRKNVIMALYPLPDDASDEVIGVLPEGEWTLSDHAIFGRVEETYFAVYLTSPYEIRQRSGYYLVECKGHRTGVVVEAIGSLDAKQRGMSTLEDFVHKMSACKSRFFVDDDHRMEYTSFLEKELLTLSVKKPGNPGEARANGDIIAFDHYVF
ncbi:hypothetical protein DFP94_102331 [Fontibacillus phaseoli]|uniref:Heparinase II/III-like protein n=1 Tax=Fontibacillus phaseoli TaxID=1416533 RepID=A0A369BLS5_9BACL|nr:hypothetical protein [Fontibacillus phaseoli]RCX21578.1 hypothetical protein DFP94_102331 [Fontibacillus phaseoli]